MKNYRNAIAVLVLVLMLSPLAHADDGIIWTGKAAPTPTPTTSSTSLTETADGIMTTDAATPASEAADTVTEIALSLLQSVLSLV
jgi:hypothetical protein